jgi:hypothetical protein
LRELAFVRDKTNQGATAVRAGRDAPRTASGFPTARTLLRIAATQDRLLYTFVNPEFSLSTALIAFSWYRLRPSAVLSYGVKELLLS